MRFDSGSYRVYVVEPQRQEPLTLLGAVIGDCGAGSDSCQKRVCDFCVCTYELAEIASRI